MSSALMTHTSVLPEQRAALGISDQLIRVSVGLEDASDLCADMTAALDTVAAQLKKLWSTWSAMCTCLSPPSPEPPEPNVLVLLPSANIQLPTSFCYVYSGHSLLRWLTADQIYVMRYARTLNDFEVLFSTYSYEYIDTSDSATWADLHQGLGVLKHPQKF